MRLVPFRLTDLALLTPHAGQQAEFEQLSAETRRLTQASAVAYTMTEAGRVIWCGGILKDSEDMGLVWSYFSVGSRPMVKYAKDVLDKMVKESGCSRVGVAVKEDFKAGHRLIKHLGFKPAGSLPKPLGPTGAQYLWYERIETCLA